MAVAWLLPLRIRCGNNDGCAINAQRREEWAVLARSALGSRWNRRSAEVFNEWDYFSTRRIRVPHHGAANGMCRADKSAKALFDHLIDELITPTTLSI